MKKFRRNPSFLQRVAAFFLIFLAFAVGSYAQTGDPAAARQYVRRAESAIEQGRWPEALVILERGSDYADVSSDLSYLLAQARSCLDKPRGSVLEALRRALGSDRWERYTPQQARLLEAENLIALKSYGEALNVLALAGENAQSAGLRLSALRFGSGTEEFYRHTEAYLSRYPRDTGGVRGFLAYLLAEDLKGSAPEPGAARILELILKRLPLLIPLDGELAWMAAPFMRDTREAAELVAAYRAAHEPVPASLPAALDLGLIDEKTALEELFSLQNRASGIDMALLEKVWDLLRNEESREIFRRYLSGFTGVISEDTNGDGFWEARGTYANGVLGNYRFDGNQENLPELIIDFEDGSPKTAKTVLPPEPGTKAPALSGKGEDPRRIIVRWEKYPAVMEAELGEERFIFRPLELFYAPARIPEKDQVPEMGLVFPERDLMAPALTRRVLIAHALRVERPGREFPGALETVELNAGIPVRAREDLGGVMISETEFLRGRPQAQRADLDLDGRFETWRHFRRFSLVREDGSLAPPETLLDYGRDFDYAESDLDGDGIYMREYFP